MVLLKIKNSLQSLNHLTFEIGLPNMVGVGSNDASEGFLFYGVMRFIFLLDFHFFH